MKKLFLAVVTLCWVSNAAAVESCQDPQTTAEMRDCAAADYQRVDRELNDVYQKLLKVLDDEGQHKLRESQRAWVKYRDANAELIADSSRGGTLEPLTRVSAMTQMTQERVGELRKELDLRR